MKLAIQEQVSLAPHTIYKIGGPARFFAEIKNTEELREAVHFAQTGNLPIFILGAGSNILIADSGFAGLVIHLRQGTVAAENNKLIVGADVMMAQAVLKAAAAGLSGFEWGIGVPGTVGGSVRGNAGCFGGEMKDIVEEVSIFNLQSGAKEELNRQQCQFGYRDSIFKKHPEWFILSVTLKLRPGEVKQIQEAIRRISTERTEKQDIGTKSCGCIFKNVAWNRPDLNKNKLLEKFPELRNFKDRENIPASFLLDAAGLKGKQIGKAAISSRHANFFINEGGATAEEVIMLIAAAKETVKRKFGIVLEEEIQYVGF